jgi:hypothetical protein
MLHSAAHEPDMEAAMHSVIEPATTIVPPIRARLRVVSLAGDQPKYRPIGGGKFEPVNAAAVKECDDWNRYAAAWNARTAARESAVQ